MTNGGKLMEKNRTTVKIAGKEYTMSSYDPEDYVQRVASYVDKKMSDLSIATKLPSQQLAVLVAMSIADDMLKAHDENNRLKREIGIAYQENEALQRELASLKNKGANETNDRTSQPGR